LLFWLLVKDQVLEKMKNKSLSFRSILIESLILGIVVFVLYGLNLDALKKYPIFVLIGIPVIFIIRWLLIKATRKFTNWKEVKN